MKLLLLSAAVFLVVPLDAQRRRGGAQPSVWNHIVKTYDKNGDGSVSLSEHGRGERAFANLDRDKDGSITAADFERSGRRRRRRAGGAAKDGSDEARKALAHSLSDMFGSFLNQDGKPGIDRAEWDRIIKLLDADAGGRIPTANMGNILGRAGQGRMARMAERMMPRTFDVDRDGDITVDDLNALFKILDADGDGNIEAGKEIDLPPGPGEVAPDFTLPYAKDVKKTVTLSSFKGKKPVALIFGSYT